MKHKYVVNVIIPVYNGEEFIYNSLMSLINQTYKNIRIIIVDDGSTDKTNGIVCDIQKNYRNIFLLKQANKGPGAARNAGLIYSYSLPSDFTIILDSDDLFYPNFIEIMVNNSIKYNADISICKCIEKNIKTNRICKNSTNIKTYLLPKNIHKINPLNINDNLFIFCVGWTWDKLYKTSFIKSTGLVFQELKNTDDAYFVFCSLFKANIISIVKEKLIIHSINNKKSVSYNRYNDYLCSWKAIEAIKKELIKSNLYIQYEKGFVNWALVFSIWFLGSMPKLKIDDSIFDVYFDKSEKILNLNNYKSNYFKYKRSLYLHNCIKNKNYKQFIKLANKNNIIKKIYKKIESRNIPVLRHILKLMFKIYKSFG